MALRALLTSTSKISHSLESRPSRARSGFVSRLPEHAWGNAAVAQFVFLARAFSQSPRFCVCSSPPSQRRGHVTNIEMCQSHCVSDKDEKCLNHARARNKSNTKKGRSCVTYAQQKKYVAITLKRHYTFTYFRSCNDKVSQVETTTITPLARDKQYIGHRTKETVSIVYRGHASQCMTSDSELGP